MPRNIVICCDGTDNQFSGDHTNVIRMYKVSARSKTQLTFYDCGVGTMPEPWNTGRLARRWSMLKGLAAGSGFSENIEDAYRFLMATYEPGDAVFLFGFSRGAFTVRALAGMLHSVGLLYPGTENLIRYAQEYWEQDIRNAPNATYQTAGQELCGEFRKSMTRPCPVHFIGVWDTVSSVGYVNQWKTYPFTAHNPNVSHVRHAVSIDERRCFFRQNLMFKDFPAQDIKNVWFSGVHSDVGGGYPPPQAGLAKVAFAWMADQAGKCGLQIDSKQLSQEVYSVGAQPDCCADQHESLHGYWRCAEYIPALRYNWEKREKEWRLPLGACRDVRRNASDPTVFVHQSVIDRLAKRSDYRPANIPHTEAELRSLFKIEPWSDPIPK